MEAASMLCSRVTAVRLAVRGKDRRRSSAAGLFIDKRERPAGRRIVFDKKRQEYRRENISPATIPAAAILIEGMLPLFRIRRKESMTNAIRADCSISWVTAGI